MAKSQTDFIPAPAPVYLFCSLEDVLNVSVFSCTPGDFSLGVIFWGAWGKVTHLPGKVHEERGGKRLVPAVPAGPVFAFYLVSVPGPLLLRPVLNRFPPLVMFVRWG